MPKFAMEFYPGTILHNAIMGAFRAKGLKFDAWCRAHDISPAAGRHITFGQTGGPIGREKLEMMIEAGGREFVELVYSTQLLAHSDTVQRAIADRKAA